MNEYINALARELAKRINEVVDLPFLSEEEEELFFQLVLSKTLEIVMGYLLDWLNVDPGSEPEDGE